MRGTDKGLRQPILSGVRRIQQAQDAWDDWVKSQCKLMVSRPGSWDSTAGAGTRWPLNPIQQTRSTAFVDLICFDNEQDPVLKKFKSGGNFKSEFICDILD